MDAAPIGKLPPEIRNGIFALVLTLDFEVTVIVSPDSPGIILDSASRPGVHTALACMAVCKQLRTECSPVFYGANIFRLRSMFGPPGNHMGPGRHRNVTMEMAIVRGGWLYCLGENVQHLRSIIIEYPDTYPRFGIAAAQDDVHFYMRDSIKGMRQLFRSTPATLSVSFFVQWVLVDGLTHDCKMLFDMTSSYGRARDAVMEWARRVSMEGEERPDTLPPMT
ncbi:hypothetical protein LTS10_005596 [Elasticomyces elasticus]|nr:hypothetical protein LTS10_005596 [Elasticomyces elasticus]